VSTWQILLVLLTYGVLGTLAIVSMLLVYKRRRRELTMSKRWAPTMLVLNSLILQGPHTDIARLAKFLLTELDPEFCPKSYFDDVRALRMEMGLPVPEQQEQKAPEGQEVKA